ncbi:hypothetical protein LP419_31725 [Massilia sp. H-1]|nr:hypothetical protein LP419_31725 [Massilia sp. H-1]
MAEAEDVITDAARHATIFARLVATPSAHARRAPSFAACRHHAPPRPARQCGLRPQFRGARGPTASAANLAEQAVPARTGARPPCRLAGHRRGQHLAA